MEHKFIHLRCTAKGPVLRISQKNYGNDFRKTRYHADHNLKVMNYFGVDRGENGIIQCLIIIGEPISLIYLVDKMFVVHGTIYHNT